MHPEALGEVTHFFPFLGLTYLRGPHWLDPWLNTATRSFASKVAKSDLVSVSSGHLCDRLPGATLAGDCGPARGGQLHVPHLPRPLCHQHNEGRGDALVSAFKHLRGVGGNPDNSEECPQPSSLPGVPSQSQLHLGSSHCQSFHQRGWRHARRSL